MLGLLFLLLYFRVMLCAIIQMGGTTGRIIWLLMHNGKPIRKITEFMACSSTITHWGKEGNNMLKISVLFVLLCFCERDSLFSDDISGVVVILWTSFPAALIPSSFTFYSVYRCSREYSVSQQCMCLSGCTVEKTVHYDFFWKVHVFDHVMRSRCSSQILL